MHQSWPGVRRRRDSQPSIHLPRSVYLSGMKIARLGLEQVLLLGEELVVGGDRLAAEARRREIDQVGELAHGRSHDTRGGRARTSRSPGLAACAPHRACTCAAAAGGRRRRRRPRRDPMRPGRHPCLPRSRPSGASSPARRAGSAHSHPATRSTGIPRADAAVCPYFTPMDGSIKGRRGTNFRGMVGRRKPHLR